MDNDKLIRNLSQVYRRVSKAGIDVAQQAGEYINNHQDEIRKGIHLTKTAAEEAVISIKQTIHDAAALKQFSKEKIAHLKGRIEQQGVEYRRVTSASLARHRMLDSLAVGGDLLADILANGAPDDVKAAFAAAYPQESQHISFEDAVRSLPDDHLTGLVSAVKGKLFEMEYVDYLNHGNLPDDYTAVLATSATQPGWDIAIHGPDGHVADLLQMKATDSVEYVRHALERYPDIDVVTTNEVYSQLVMNGAADHVMGADISNADLTQIVTDAADHSTISMHWTPPVISLALIAFTAYTLKDADIYSKSKHFGDRAGKSYLAYLIGGGVSVATQTWWLGLLAGIGSRYLAATGKRQRDQYHDLQQVVVTNENILGRLRLVQIN